MWQQRAILQGFEKFHRDCQEDLHRQVKNNAELTRIKTKSNNAMLKFKYQQGCKFDEPYQYACRGTMYMQTENKWVYSMSKFFNNHELKSRLGYTLGELQNILAKQKYTLQYFPKFDGSNVTIFSDEHRNIHAYTMGSVDMTIKMQDDAPAFSARAISLLTDKQRNTIIANPFHTCIFELCTKHNQIVTEYDDEFLHFICDIDSKDGIPRMALLKPRIDGYGSHEQVLFEMKQRQDVYGDVPEGSVCWAIHAEHGWCFPIAKQKTEDYLQLHRSIGKKDNQWWEICWLQNKLDDYNDEQPHEHLHMFSMYIDEICNIIIALNLNIKDRKVFANTIKASNMPMWARQALFTIKKIPSDVHSAKKELVIYLLKKNGKKHNIEKLQSNMRNGRAWWL